MKTKNKAIKITSISACPLPELYESPTMIFGLGSDGKVYFWNDVTGKWLLNLTHFNGLDIKLIK